MSDGPTLVRGHRVAKRERAHPTEAQASSYLPANVLPKKVDDAFALRIQRGADEVILPLDDERRYIIGRHDAADVVFEDPSVSRIHGVLKKNSNQWEVEDYASSNGTVLFSKPDSQKSTMTPTSLTLKGHVPTPLLLDEVVEFGNGNSKISLVLHSTSTLSSPSIETEKSEAARKFAKKLKLASLTRVPVFLLGASGSGKTHTARRLHANSNTIGPFVPVNCARLPRDPTALHSELLGHVKDAFTGADGARVGKLIMANHGTLFLDEVESLSEMAQGFLLDVLEGSGDLAELGAKSLKLSPPLFRLLSASKRPLGESGLRPDLCERLAEGHMWRLPLLEERREDIPGFIRSFLDEQEKLLGINVDIQEDAMHAAQDASWPGQIRQLKASLNVVAQLAFAEQQLRGGIVERVLLTKSSLLRHLEERERAFGVDSDFDGASSVLPNGLRTKVDPKSVGKEELKILLHEVAGNQSAAARRLGIARNTLAKKVKEFNLGHIG
ncbi:MAG: FHA domain-containing protein [Deltaproteobacteria bacterium]|nr:FHA domain-containing protein [Deltaproteobacteria bacterium]